jgi:hypothetical protein
VTSVRDGLAAAQEAGLTTPAFDEMEKAIDVFDTEIMCEDEDWDALGRFIRVS